MQDVLYSAEVYDPITNVWAHIQSMPAARWSFSVGVINDEMYTLGGISNEW